MTERTSHLTGLWIGAAISNASLSNKAGFTTAKRDGTHLAFDATLDWRCHFKHVSLNSTTAKRARLTGKGSRSTAVLSH
jgi:hypothetical protein